MADACCHCALASILSVTAVPEPSSILLFIVGAVSVLVMWRVFWWKRSQRPHTTTEKTRVNIAWKGICLWLMANICLLIVLYFRVKMFLPDTAAAECSVLVLLWDISPLFGMLCFLYPRKNKSQPNPAIYVVVIGISVYGMHEFVNAYYVYPADGQVGLSLVVVPFVEWLVFLPAFLLSWGGRPSSTESQKDD